MAKNYSAEIKMLKQCIKDMEQMKEMLRVLEDSALAIENELCEIDEILPLREDLAKIRDARERTQVEKAIELLEQSFGLIDEILGPPQDELTGEPEGTAFSPEARGNGHDVSLEEIMGIMKTQSKHHTS